MRVDDLFASTSRISFVVRCQIKCWPKGSVDLLQPDECASNSDFEQAVCRGDASYEGSSNYEGRTVDALAMGGDEGRGQLR